MSAIGCGDTGALLFGATSAFGPSEFLLGAVFAEAPVFSCVTVDCATAGFWDAVSDPLEAISTLAVEQELGLGAVCWVWVEVAHLEAAFLDVEVVGLVVVQLEAVAPRLELGALDLVVSDVELVDLAGHLEMVDVDSAVTALTVDSDTLIWFTSPPSFDLGVA